jgi:uncharacterized DUF497 family protein
MDIEFDTAKDESNVAKHGLLLSRAVDLEILRFVEDERNEYGEIRYRAWGLIDGKTHCLAFTYRDGALRAISLRRAHKKEFDRYVEKDSG